MIVRKSGGMKECEKVNRGRKVKKGGLKEKQGEVTNGRSLKK